MRISGFVVGFAVISLIAVVFAFFIGAMDAKYSSSTLNESQLASYDKIEQMNELAGEMNSSLQRIEQGSSIDIIGGLVTSGFTVLKSTWASFSMYTDVVNDGVDKANFGPSAQTWKTILLIIGILLFIFAMVAVLVGRDL